MVLIGKNQSIQNASVTCIIFFLYEEWVSFIIVQIAIYEMKMGSRWHFQFFLWLNLSRDFGWVSLVSSFTGWPWEWGQGQRLTPGAGPTSPYDWYFKALPWRIHHLSPPRRARALERPVRRGLLHRASYWSLERLLRATTKWLSTLVKDIQRPSVRQGKKEGFSPSLFYPLPLDWPTREGSCFPIEQTRPALPPLALSCSPFPHPSHSLRYPSQWPSPNPLLMTLSGLLRPWSSSNWPRLGLNADCQQPATRLPIAGHENQFPIEPAPWAILNLPRTRGWVLSRSEQLRAVPNVSLSAATRWGQILSHSFRV